jgi:hypothetical protein
VNILDGEAEDLLAECDDYEAKIKAAGGGKSVNYNATSLLNVQLTLARLLFF